MNDREALLTGMLLGALQGELRRVDSAFTYTGVVPMIELNGEYTNRILVLASDGEEFVITVEQAQP